MFSTAPRRRSVPVLFAIAVIACLAGRGTAAAQGSALLSPGPLSKAHAGLEGLGNCAKCHEPGRQVTASRCLACHRPIAERIAARRGVHRNVTSDCVGCHSEHNGVNAELRPFDARHFDHAAETGFALDGRHAAIAGSCAKCHAGRSFLQARAACSSCHADPHRGSLGVACATCHTTQAAFTDARRTFDHSRAKFALLGAHRAVECTRCHVNKTFAGLRFASCTDCHKSPHRAVLARDCTSCHGNDTWRTQKVDHARTAFPLRGRHDTVPCARCHQASPMQVRLKFARCADCHTDVHRGQFKEDCAACHQETGFRTVPFDHAARTRFPLTGAHVGLPCARCHANARTVAATLSNPAEAGGSPEAPGSAGAARPSRGAAPGASRAAPGTPAAAVVFAGASAACSSCHADPHRGETASDCATCHTTGNFRVAAYRHEARLAPFFAGRHGAASCADCHGRLAPRAFESSVQPASRPQDDTTTRTPVAKWRFKGLGTACATCHADPHQGPQVGPDAGSRSGTGDAPAAGTRREAAPGPAPASCETCHAVDEPAFSASRFSHAKTRFPLTGKHQAVDCARCHRAGPADTGRQPAVAPASLQQGASPPSGAGRRAPLVFKTMGSDCASCHGDVHLGQLGAQCQRCHSPETFRLTTFTHQDKSLVKFFVGTHATLTCRACHKPEQARYPGGSGMAVRYVGAGAACSSCHAGDDAHHGALGSACETCHEPAAWRSASRAFHKAGLFPLEGRHLSVPCASCHANGVMKGTPTTCFDCHWQRRQDDRYHARLGTQCEQCHRPTSWLAVQFNHAASTGFQLNLAHQVLRCDNCHKDGQFIGTSNNCFGCHQPAFARTTQPNHVAAGFPTNCELCHKASQTSWTQATFDHRSFFPLVGVHASQACASCHRNNVYAGTTRDCIGCHQADYQKTQSPNHVAAGFPTACEACHRASDPSWRGASFTHASFPLVGVHATQACSACHKNSVYRGTPRDCVGCHQADYQKTQSPNHVAAGFPTACEACHRASDPSWRGAAFNHATFPLVGVHATQACSACHKNSVYKGTPRDCVGCHQADYQRSQNPNHAAAGFPTTCDTCHSASSSSWSASFDHNRFFPLLGRHQQQACSACHKNNVYAGTPTDCYPCHQANYQSAQNPNHIAAGFPTACQPCHKPSDSSWQQGTFNHTWFPITSGRHAGNPCSACHTSPSNFAVFTCTTCHGRATTDSHHTGVNGYRYDSAACYACHPNGRSD